MKLESYKCSNCYADLAFEPYDKTVTCGYCGATYNIPKTKERYVSEKSSETKEESSAYINVEALAKELNDVLRGQLSLKDDNRWNVSHKNDSIWDRIPYTYCNKVNFDNHDRCLIEEVNRNSIDLGYAWLLDDRRNFYLETVNLSPESFTPGCNPYREAIDKWTVYASYDEMKEKSQFVEDQEKEVWDELSGYLVGGQKYGELKYEYDHLFAAHEIIENVIGGIDTLNKFADIYEQLDDETKDKIQLYFTGVDKLRKIGTEYSEEARKSYPRILKKLSDSLTYVNEIYNSLEHEKTL